MAESKPSAKARRSAARLAAVQALYQIELTGAELEPVLGEFVRHRFGAELDGERYVEPEPALFGEIVRGVQARRADLDPMIRSALGAQWTVERLELLLVAILRAGVWELLTQRAVAPRIIMNEYINLTHAFFGGREPGMVNAVLDRVAHVLRSDELIDEAPVHAGPAQG